MSWLENIEGHLDAIFMEIKRQPRPLDAIGDVLNLLPGLFEEAFLPERIDPDKMAEVMRILRDKAANPDD